MLIATRSVYRRVINFSYKCGFRFDLVFSFVGYMGMEYLRRHFIQLNGRLFPSQIDGIRYSLYCFIDIDLELFGLFFFLSLYSSLFSIPMCVRAPII